MKTKETTKGWDCDFCQQKAAHTVYFHGLKYACEACQSRLVKEERARQNKKGE